MSPADQPTRIRCFIDFEQDGKQVGYLQLPHSSNVSAYGWIGIPICVVKNGSGPTLYLGAGNHGDEYEGQITLARLIRELDPASIQGRLIILPASNFPAAMVGSRCSPIDDGNLNRSFPGDPDGRPTSAIAHFIENVLMPKCDGLLDMHSGGKTLDYIPSALMRKTPGGDPRFEQKLAALQAYGAPIGYIVSDGREDRTIIAGADRKGVVALGTELGGAGTVTLETLKVARRGLYNFMAHFGVIERSPYADATPQSRLLEVGGPDYYIHAPCRGLYEPAVELGHEVEAGQTVGWIHFMDDPVRPPVEITFARAGTVFCTRPILQVERGDCLAHLGTDYSG